MCSLYKLIIASFPGLPYLVFHHLQGRQKAGELGIKADFMVYLCDMVLCLSYEAVQVTHTVHVIK